MVYDEAGVERYVRIDSLREPHDLVWNGQTFLAVSTLSNSVLWISPSGEVTRTWRADGDGDAWHLNSLFPVNGTVVAAAFGRFSNHREWSNGRAAGAGIVFDLKTGVDVVNGLSCPHHPRLIAGSWLICNSAERELVLADAASGAIERRIALQGWTRGLAVDNGVIYVGESADNVDPAPRRARERCHDRAANLVGGRSDPASLRGGLRRDRGSRVTRPRSPDGIPHESIAGSGAGSTLALSEGRRPSCSPLGRR